MSIDLERHKFEVWWEFRLSLNGESTSFARDKYGDYHARFVRDAWDAWLAALFER